MITVPRRDGKMATMATQEEFRSREDRRGILTCGDEYEGCSILRDVNLTDQLTLCVFLYSSVAIQD